MPARWLPRTGHGAAGKPQKGRPTKLSYIDMGVPPNCVAMTLRFAMKEDARTRFPVMTPVPCMRASRHP